MKEPAFRRRPLIQAAALVGFGMAALFDGIVLRELLERHLAAGAQLPGADPSLSIENLRASLRWGAVRDLIAWAITAYGVLRLWRVGFDRSTARSPRTFTGAVLAGAGVFLILESVIAHYAPGLHAVSLAAAAWGTFCLLAGALLAAVGAALLEADARRGV